MKNKSVINIFVAMCLLSAPAFADFREHFDLGQNYLSQYQYSGAITEFKSALRINYLDTSARIGLINSYLARGAEYANKDKDWAKAADDYRNALFYLKYYPPAEAVTNSSQVISQVVNNLDVCLDEIKYDRTPQNRFENAKRYRAEGNFGAAAYEFIQALGDRKLQKDSFEQTGDIMNVLGNKPKAVEYYKKAVAVSPADLNLRLTYAKSLDETDKSDEALQEYSYVLERAKQDNKELLYVLERTFQKKLSASPNNANLNANMGAILQKEGKLDEALTYYKQAEALDPSNINTRVNVGTLYQQKGDYRTAIKAYESVLILYPDNVNANLYRAQCYDKLGDDKIAQEGYKKVLALDPNNSIIKDQMLANAKKTLPAAQYIEYVKANCDKDVVVGTLYDNALELHRANKIDDAIYMYNETIKFAQNDAEPEMYVNMALAQAQGNKFDDSLTTLNKASSLFPQDTSIKDTLSNIKGMKTDNQMATAATLYDNKKYNDAIRIYLEINPPTVNSMLGVATSYQELGDKDKAIEFYKKALELKPVDSDIAYYIACLYGEKEDYENAKTYLGKAIAFNKNNTQAIEYLQSIEENSRATLLNDAIAKYEANNYEESLKDFNTLLSKDAKNDYALYYRGMIYDSMGKHYEAIKDLKDAYELNKDFKICNYMIASNYDALEKYSDARKYYLEYANSDVEDDDYKKYAQARAQELEEYVKNSTSAKK